MNSYRSALLAVLAVAPAELPAAVAGLLADPAARLALARRGLGLYRSTFAAEHTAARLLK